jgi:hypothetical protein
MNVKLSTNNKENVSKNGKFGPRKFEISKNSQTPMLKNENFTLLKSRANTQAKPAESEKNVKELLKKSKEISSLITLDKFRNKEAQNTIKEANRFLSTYDPKKIIEKDKLQTRSSCYERK